MAAQQNQRRCASEARTSGRSRGMRMEGRRANLHGRDRTMPAATDDGSGFHGRRRRPQTTERTPFTVVGVSGRRRRGEGTRKDGSRGSCD
nr:unnamed protein product [Digitaria exilis]